MKENIIKIAQELEIFTVQRFFIVDSHSIDTLLDAIKSSKPDMIEVIPGIVLRQIDTLKKLLNIPIISGDLIDDEDMVRNAFRVGEFAVSVGKKVLWRSSEVPVC